MKTEEREQARTLRREQGASIKEIAQRLGVSTSSVSLWVRDIELTPDQHELLRQRNPAYNHQRSGQRVWAARCRIVREGYQNEGREAARLGEPLHAAGCVLYWAEGSKNRNSVHLTNSDPEVLRFFISFLRAYFDISDEAFRVWCNLFADHDEHKDRIEAFWLEVLDLPRSCLNKSAVNIYSRHSRRKRTNMLRYGTCRLSVGSTRVVQHIFGAIQEYGGFERPEWLG